MALFALDHNFPEPIVEVLAEFQTEAKLVSIWDIDERMATLDDWEAGRTFRRRYLRMPGRLTRSARRWTLHLPARWPWRDAFAEALAKIRAIPALA